MKLIDVEILEEKVQFTGTDSVAITYSSFSKIPFVTATSAINNINVYTENVTRTGCTIRTSAPVTGMVHVHIIGNK